MNVFKHILVPVDFSSTGHEAFLLACRLAVRDDASITLFHVYPAPGVAYPGGFFPASDETVRKLLEHTDRALDELKTEAKAAGVRSVGTDSIEGSPVVDIVLEAEKNHYDLVVIGTHGRSALKHALLGSVAEHVVRRAPCPVLTVRTKA